MSYLPNRSWSGRVCKFFQVFSTFLRKILLPLLSADRFSGNVLIISCLHNFSGCDVRQSTMISSAMTSFPLQTILHARTLTQWLSHLQMNLNDLGCCPIGDSLGHYNLVQDSIFFILEKVFCMYVNARAKLCWPDLFDNQCFRFFDLGVSPRIL